MNQGFEGLYFKQQNENDVLCIIPAVNSNSGRSRASLQILTKDGAFFIEDSTPSFASLKHGAAQIGDSFFSYKGVHLDVKTDTLEASGNLKFSCPSYAKGDVMGVFRYAPFIGCRHSVLSMKHTVNGSITVNGKEYVFNNGIGYIEGDKGVSFPPAYIWTQCMDKEASVMMTAADINVLGKNVRGVICLVHYGGVEYRFATYLGAKIIKANDKRFSVCQKGYVLSAEFENEPFLELAAPVSGSMCRSVKHCPQLNAVFTLKKGRKTVMQLKSSLASLENELW